MISESLGFLCKMATQECVWEACLENSRSSFLSVLCLILDTGEVTFGHLVSRMGEDST